MRGNLYPPAGRRRSDGTIPAGAGEPREHYDVLKQIRDHPRGCGGTRPTRPNRDSPRGPSPRVRGNRSWASSDRRSRGTIPAGAGEPGPPSPSSPNVWDHPRGCGGTELRIVLPYSGRGPSPRVRGNLALDRAGGRHPGTIPAGAGEPAGPPDPSAGPRDHPRGCGGTTLGKDEGDAGTGPSPRVRGNRRGPGRPRGGVGTIPAGAGEPQGSRRPAVATGDHPRGCGGTPARVRVGDRDQGPSPRVRGNRRQPGSRRANRGTIPAGAGEPTDERHPQQQPRDHPRGCGGTGDAPPVRPAHQGPSPRVRGNRRPPARWTIWTRTIPAGAGEPPHGVETGGQGGDHPRGCGGTTRRQPGAPIQRGPSPRVRGNHSRFGRGTSRHGTIPAGAGEPAIPTISRCPTRDHPRGCGGTTV